MRLFKRILSPISGTRSIRLHFVAFPGFVAKLDPFSGRTCPKYLQPIERNNDPSSDTSRVHVRHEAEGLDWARIEQMVKYWR